MVGEKKKPMNLSIDKPSESDEPGHISVEQTLDRVNLFLRSGAKATVLLHGATIISWTVDSKELLFLSDKAVLDGSKPVRGGIPLVFPVFGKATSGPTAELAQHGFARTSRWELLGRTEESDDCLSVDFGLGPEALSDDVKKVWGYNFGLIYSVVLTKDTLETKMLVQNGGDKPFEFNMLFHSYFRVPDIGQVSISGLNGVSYKDKVAGTESSETSDSLKIAGECDRVYKSVPGPVIVKDGGKTLFTIEKRGLDDVVIWNPSTGASKMADFGPSDGYKNMICVEAGSVSDWQSLEPGATWEGAVVAKAHL